MDNTQYRIYGTHPGTTDYCIGTPNDLLFGDLGGDEDNYSRLLATRKEAEAALAKLNTTGDWDGERPVYEIEATT